MRKCILCYIHNLLVALDQLLNAILAGDPDETLSGRAHRLQHIKGWGCFASVLNWVDPGHTHRATIPSAGARDLIWPHSDEDGT